MRAVMLWGDAGGDQALLTASCLGSCSESCYETVNLLSFGRTMLPFVQMVILSFLGGNSMFIN